MSKSIKMQENNLENLLQDYIIIPIDTAKSEMKIKDYEQEKRKAKNLCMIVSELMKQLEKHKILSKQESSEYKYIFNDYIEQIAEDDNKNERYYY